MIVSSIRTRVAVRAAIAVLNSMLPATLFGQGTSLLEVPANASVTCRPAPSRVQSSPVISEGGASANGRAARITAPGTTARDVITYFDSSGRVRRVVELVAGKATDGTATVDMYTLMISASGDRVAYNTHRQVRDLSSPRPAKLTADETLKLADLAAWVQERCPSK